MAGLNVRNLISRFEQLTTGFENNEPKTPITPKVSSRQFFPETANYAQKNSNTKLLKIEAQITAVKEQIRVIEEVSNDDFVKILFSLLNLLIELAAIEVDGNYNVKQKKTQCFNAIIECKDCLVECLDEDFATDNGIIDKNVTYIAKETENENEVSRSSEVINIVGEPPIFCAVSKMKNFFESKTRDEAPPTSSNSINLEPVTPISSPNNYFDQKASNIPEAKSPKKSTDSETSEISEPETVISKEVYDNYASNNSIYESITEIKLTSVKKMKDLFEAKSTENIAKARPSTTLDKLIRELSPDTDIAPRNDVKPEINDIVTVDKQRALMETLMAELEYYKSLVESMDPADDVRAEVLEENLVEMFLEINKFETCGDEGLRKQKEDAISSAQFLQTKIIENKTNIGHYFTNLEENDTEPKLPPAGDFEGILVEVERYKELVANYNPVEQGRGNGRFLEENICEVLLLLDNYSPDDETEKVRKMRAIKDLGLILNELSGKGNEESNEEKHYVAVRPPSLDEDDNELVSDVNFKNYIAVCPPAPLDYEPTSLNNYNQTSDNDDEQCNYLAICPVAPPDYQPSYPIKIEDDFASEYSELLNLTNATDDNVEEQFDELVKENLIVQEKDPHPAAPRLKDIGVEVNIFKDILKELEIFDLEELEIFKMNVAEIEEILMQLDCHEDPECELQKKDILVDVRAIQDRLEKFKKI